MYSIVLMVAMQAGAQAPADHGCVGGCGGYTSCSGCFGCHGCNGCHGGGLFGGRLFGCHGCNGCRGSYGCCGGSYGCTGCTGGTVAPVKKEMPAEKIPAPGKAAAPGALIITLPADARLTIDDQPTRSTDAERRFFTPPLERGKDFYYTLKAEVVRNGQTFSAVQTVTVRSGEETRVSIDIPVAVAQR